MRQALSLITIAWRLEDCSEQTLTVADLISKCISPFHAKCSFNIPDFLLNEVRIKLGPSHPWLQLARKTQDLTTTTTTGSVRVGLRVECVVSSQGHVTSGLETTVCPVKPSPWMFGELVLRTHSWLVNTRWGNPDLDIPCRLGVGLRIDSKMSRDRHGVLRGLTCLWGS